MPGKTPIYLGSYGISAGIAQGVHGLPGARYAPMFPILPHPFYWERRRLPPKDDAKLQPRFRGEIPPFSRLPRLSPDDRLRWGVELGGRFRDAIRAARADGVAVETWQLDEIMAECAARGGLPLRHFVRGVLRGLHLGRRPLGDGRIQGLVWMAHTAFPLARRRPHLELSTFWRQLNLSALRLVGEEYPDFVGDPRAVARVFGQGQRDLAAGGPVRRALARKYVAGMTPGYRLGVGIGGNVRHLPRAEVNRWRETYVRARAEAGVAGFAEFTLRFENARVTVLRDVMLTLARYL
jgi:hypothetical protein